MRARGALLVTLIHHMHATLTITRTAQHGRTPLHQPSSSKFRGVGAWECMRIEFELIELVALETAVR